MKGNSDTSTQLVINLLIKKFKEIVRDLKEKEQENNQLKKILGEKDLEISILRDLLKKVNPQLKIK